MAANFLDGATNKAMISMSVPISIGMLSTFLFQVIDTYFVGQLGASQLAALSFASTVYFLLVGLFIGLTIGVSIIVGTAFGGKDVEKGKRASTISILLALLLSLILSGIGVVSIKPLFTVLGASGQILDHITSYMVPLYSGMPLLMVSLIAGGSLRSTGIVKMPEVIMGIGGIINLVFDYLLIFGVGAFPALGIEGAALATVLSWVFIFIAMSILILKQQLFTGAVFREFHANVALLKTLFKLGSPAILTQLVNPATLMFITFLLSREAATAVAAYGVAGRIETLLLIGILGISTAVTPFIAQNLGAEKHLRIDEAIVFGGKASVYLGILLFVFLILFIEPVAALFSTDGQVIEYTVTYFFIVGFSYVYYGLYLITSSIFNGLQLPVNSLKIMLVKTFLFTVPLTLFGAYFSVSGIFIGLALSNILGGIYAGREMRAQFQQAGSPLAERNPLADYKTDIIALKNALLSLFR